MLDLERQFCYDSGNQINVRALLRSFPNPVNSLSVPEEPAALPPTCACEHTELRVRTYANDTQHYVHQCITCGRQASTAMRKSAVPEPTRCKPFDEMLLAAQEQRWRSYQNIHQAERAQSAKEWWHRYDRYLLTPEWAAKRNKVFERDKDICQGCFEHKPMSVHHLSYRHVGCEFLFELISLCVECHNRLHRLQDRTRIPLW